MTVEKGKWIGRRKVMGRIYRHGCNFFIVLSYILGQLHGLLHALGMVCLSLHRSLYKSSPIVQNATFLYPLMYCVRNSSTNMIFCC